MKHRPEYISTSAPYVRPALYAPPSQALLLARPHRAITRWSASWRSLVYLFGVLFALATLFSMFAYGVKVIADADTGPTSSTWVTPSTYGAPVGTPR